MITTGLSELDVLMNGGLDDGELGMVLAGVGKGKSHFLIHLGSSALRQRKKVWHVSLELGRHYVSQRYDACLEHQSEEIQESYLRIGEHPANRLTFEILSYEYDRLLSLNFKPDLFILDYPQLMKNEFQLVFFELRNFGMDRKLPIWGSSQLVRQMDEGCGVTPFSFYSADIVLHLQRSEEMDMTKMARLFVSKNRKGVDNISIPLWNVDLSKSHFEVDSDTFASIIKNRQPNVKFSDLRMEHYSDVLRMAGITNKH